MSVISRQEKVDKRWLTWVPYNEYSCLYFETDYQMTEEEAQLKLDEALTPPKEEDGVTE